MTEIVIVDEPTEPQVSEAVETAALVDSAIDHVVEAVTDEEHHDDNVALLVGTAIATLDALCGRVDALEQRLPMVEAATEIAIDVAEKALEIAVEEPVVEVVEEPEPEPDEPPATRKSRFNGKWFGG